MKKFLCLTVLATSFSSFAAIMQEGDLNRTMCAREFRDSAIKPLACMVTTTTSLPTVLIDSVELDLNSSEASQRLIAEAHQDVKPELIEAISQELNANTDLIRETILKLEAKNEAPTLQSIVAELLK